MIDAVVLTDAFAAAGLLFALGLAGHFGSAASSQTAGFVAVCALVMAACAAGAWHQGAEGQFLGVIILVLALPSLCRRSKPPADTSTGEGR